MKTRPNVVFLSTLIAASLFFTLGCGFLGDMLEGTAEETLEGIVETLMEDPIAVLPEEAAESAPEVSPATTVNVDDLSSYRLEMAVTVRQAEGETRNIYLFEWTKEPFIYRRLIDMSGFVTDYIWAEGKVWTRTGDGEWFETQDDKPDPLEGVSMDSSTEGMTFEGEEIINGIRCKCYVGETVFPHITIQSRMCVADQAGIPPLVIHHSMQSEQEDILSITETNLYDINQPFSIETPE